VPPYQAGPSPESSGPEMLKRFVCFVFGLEPIGGVMKVWNSRNTPIHVVNSERVQTSEANQSA